MSICAITRLSCQIATSELIHDVFDGQGIPDDLALYLHIPTKTDPSMAPPGGESLYVLAPVPNLAHGIDWEQ